MSTLSQAHADEPRIDWTLVRTSLCSLTALALHVCMYVCMHILSSRITMLCFEKTMHKSPNLNRTSMCCTKAGSKAAGYFNLQPTALLAHMHTWNERTKDTVIFKQYERIELLQLSHHVCEGRDTFMAAVKEAG